MSKSITVAFVATLAITSVTTAYAQGTTAQRAACTSDVFRLCSSEIPNVAGITACLRREKPNLSQACRDVFNTLDRAPRTVASVEAKS